jgi:acetyl-CoA acetyltransferase
MTDAFICDAIRTPIGRYGGVLAAVRPVAILDHPPVGRRRHCSNG